MGSLLKFICVQLNAPSVKPLVCLTRGYV